ncbi:MAG: hypothetical protein LBK73_07710 [Treponema sp.]|jgi:hypothetical protein|nr:hypothetical protein [Treponema sp.]
MVSKKRLFIFIVFIQLSATSFSDENEKEFLMQTSPLLLASDIAYLFMDNDSKTYAFLIDAEFQYAINKYFNVSVANALYFESYLSGYLENSDGRYNEKYGQQFQYMIIPAFLYRPFGTWLKGMYISAFPVIGWTHVSTNYLDDTFTHLGLGLTGGYQWIFKNGFTMQLGTGLGKTWIIPFAKNKGEYRMEDEWRFFNWPIDFKFIFRVGYSF